MSRDRSSRPARLLATGLLLALGARAADAQGGGFSPDRPGSTTGPALLPRGVRSLEMGYRFAREGAEQGHAIGELLLRVGVLDAAELRLGLNSYEVTHGPGRHAAGLADAVLATKLRLAAGGEGPSPRPAVALVLGASLPTGARGVAHRPSEPELTLAGAWHLPRDLQLTVNAGAASRDHGTGARTGEYRSGAALSFALPRGLGGYVGYVASRTGTPGSLAQYLDGGVTLVRAGALQLDAWTAVGLHHGAPDYSAGLGLARRW